MISRSRSLRCSNLPVLAGIITLAIFFYTQSRHFARISLYYPFNTLSCSPEQYSSGQWSSIPPRSNKTRMTNSSDVLEFSGFEGCASSREVYWHLGSLLEEHWDRFPAAQSYVWRPQSECRMADFSAEALVQDLVERGGWLLIGDSVSENHFFSLSCLLYPHVIATPDWNHGYYDHAYPQNLYLNPKSPLIPLLRLPRDFNVVSTPLVTHRRIDLLFSKEELVDLHQELYHPPVHFKLFSDEVVYTGSPDEYLDVFLDPARRYSTMIVSTAGHWTIGLFLGFHDGSMGGIDRVLGLFEKAMDRWVAVVQSRLDQSNVRMKGRQVFVRAYHPGHEDCHSYRAPLTKIPELNQVFNWREIPEFNRIFKDVISRWSLRNIHYLGIDRPGRLRPDSHTTDCLHIMSGAGVLEGWTHYIWHFLNFQMPESWILWGLDA